MDEQLKKKVIEQLNKDAFEHHLFRDVKNYRAEVEARRAMVRYSEI